VQEDTCAALQSQYDAMVADFDACRRYVGITRTAVTYTAAAVLALQ
jgi:hypothetical protein